MEFPPLVPGVFQERNNRFRALVQVSGRPEAAHLPNSGRLSDLLHPGRRVWLAPVDKPGRKTGYDLKLVELDTGLVCVDARLPNPLFAEGLSESRVINLPYRQVDAEVRHGASRLDFRLSGDAGVCWVETKSVTLVEQGVAYFPDAPTARGRRHLETLQAARAVGDRALVAFVVQRADADAFAPYHELDPDFAAALLASRTAGVAVRAFTCRVSLAEIRIDREIPVRLRSR